VTTNRISTKVDNLLKKISDFISRDKLHNSRPETDTPISPDITLQSPDTNAPSTRSESDALTTPDTAPHSTDAVPANDSPETTNKKNEASNESKYEVSIESKQIIDASSAETRRPKHEANNEWKHEASESKQNLNSTTLLHSFPQTTWSGNNESKQNLKDTTLLDSFTQTNWLGNKYPDRTMSGLSGAYIILPPHQTTHQSQTIPQQGKTSQKTSSPFHQ
jgi:hypothetical protein